MTQTQVAKQNGSTRFTELGAPTGKTRDDFLPQLRGHRAIKVYREMSDNDDTVSELLFAIEMLMRGVDWPVEPGGETPADEEAAVFLEECKEDMSHSWPDFISNVLSFLPYGWSAHELVYKRRDGIESKYSDGRIGWRKFAYQHQETLLDWETDEKGGLQAYRWTAAGQKGVIPIEKLLLFRTTTARGPNGRSVLRGAYRSWWFKKRLEDYAAIAAEKDANGVMVAEIPADSVLSQDAVYAAYKEAVTRYHRDEQAGFVVPLEYDEDGNQLYKLSIMRSEVSSSIGAMQNLMGYYAQNIAGVVLADFVRLGRDQIGSRALAEPKQELFQKALEGWLHAIAEVLNRFAVPRLFALNDFNVETLPRFKPEEIADINLADLGSFIKDTSQAGMIWGFEDEEDPIADQIRQKAGFDAKP